MKKLFACLMVCLTFSLLLPLCVSADASARLYDGADLLTEEERESVLQKLDEVSLGSGCDFVVVTVSSTDGSGVMEYADDYYDYHGFAADGALLLISMEDRDWWISTAGACIDAINDYGIAYIGDQIVPYLSDGDYASAFLTFAEECEDFVVQAQSGEPYFSDSDYDYGSTSSADRSKQPPGIKWIAISLGVGLVIALIVTGVMRSKLKTVRLRPEASEYVRRDSLKLTESRDVFLYRTVSRTAKAESSSGGGGGSHTSSSGASHGGGGGKF